MSFPIISDCNVKLQPIASHSLASFHLSTTIYLLILRMPFVVKQEHFRNIQDQSGAFSRGNISANLYIFQNVTVLAQNVTESVTNISL
jgi:hypothetical protein